MRQYLELILSALVLTIVLYVRIRLLQLPLERDEGEYAYMGQLFLKGIPPYLNAYTMKLPGVSIIYSLFMLVFGQTSAAIHLGLLIVNGLCILLMFLLARRLLGTSAAIVSSTSYSLLSLSQSVLGTSAHATHFVVLFSLAGLILMLRAIDRKKIELLLISGLCFGLAFIMKQPAALLIVFASLYLILRCLRDTWPGRKLCLFLFAFLLGALSPYLLIVLWVAGAGTFDPFWFWTVQYAREYATNPSFLSALANFFVRFPATVSPQLALWLLAGVGGILLGTKNGQRADRTFLFGFLIFSLASVCPGFAFREHYFVLLLPAISLLIGAGYSSIQHLLSPSHPTGFRQSVPVLVLAAAILSGLYNEREYLFTLTPEAMSRRVYGDNPFPEAIQVARYLKERSTREDRVAVLGSEPEIYFYADRLSATGYIYMYGLMEEQPYAEQMQRELIHEVETSQPKYIVMISMAGSWLVQKAAPRTIFHWKDRYLKQFYDIVGIIDTTDPNSPHPVWDDEAAGYVPRSAAYLAVYKRKE
jgi:Dolichyl-phosphate-mannose-protein mannosyltransferase